MTSRCIRVAVPLLALILVASLSLVSADANHQADHRRIDVAEALLHGEAQAAVPNALFERVAAFWRGDDDNINADAAKTSANHKESTTAALSRLASDLFLISQRDAPINYCEYDFAVTPHIAEFWNTISNIAFVIVGIEGIIISARAGLRPRFYYLASLVLATGFCSALYHATLTWLGLKLDETLENLACAMLIYLGDRTIVIALVHHFFATLGIFFVTAFLFTEVHLVTCMLATLRHLHVRTAEKMRYHLYRGGAFLLAGFICWLIDRLACDLLSPVLQLHAWWHIFIALACHQAFVLSVITHGIEAAGKVQIGSWYGLSYIKHGKERDE